MLKRLLFLVMMFMINPFIGASDRQKGATLKGQIKTRLGYVAMSLPGQIIAGTGIGVINGVLWGKALHGVANAYDKVEDILQKTGRKRLLTASRIAAVSLLLPSTLLAFPMTASNLLMTDMYRTSLKKSGIVDREEVMETMMFTSLFATPATLLKFAFKFFRK